MTSASPAARPVIGESIAPTHTSLPDQPTNSSKVCQVKTAALLGSSNSISDQKVVKDTLEGIADDGPALRSVLNLRILLIVFKQLRIGFELNLVFGRLL